MKQRQPHDLQLLKSARILDFTWFLTCLNDDLLCPEDNSTQDMVGWCGCKSKLRVNPIETHESTEGIKQMAEKQKSDPIPLPNNVDYIPAIDAPPTELHTVCALMEQSIDTVDMVVNVTDNEYELKPSLFVTNGQDCTVCKSTPEYTILRCMIGQRELHCTFHNLSS